jgi:AcrR family transcriptional regulator
MYARIVDSTRNRLVDAAAQLLDEGGPSAVTLREVGRLAGVSHNAPYKHFTDKQELLAAVAARELARLHTAMQALATEHPPDEVLRAMMLGYLDWAARHPARFKLTFGPWSNDSPELAAAATAARTALVEAVANAQRSGAIPAADPERAAALLQATAHGAADLALAGHLSRHGKGNAAPSDLIEDLFRYMQSSTAPPPAR